MVVFDLSLSSFADAVVRVAQARAQARDQTQAIEPGDGSLML